MLNRFTFFLYAILLCLFTLRTGHASEQLEIRAVVFDFGGVIAKTDHSEVQNYISETLNISLNEVVETLAKLKESSRRGETDEEFWQSYADSKGIILPENWIENLNEIKFRALKVIPRMVELVKELQRQGYQTALLSNVRKSHALIKGRLGFYELFEPALFSYEIGANKPDARAYEILLERLDLPPQQILFIDNKNRNVEAARSLNIPSILFVNADQTIEDLKQYGIEIDLSE